MRSFLLLGVVLPLCLSLAACSGPTLVPVTGKVTNHGQPLKANPQRMMTIVFVPFDKGATYDTYPALFLQDSSTFTVQGPTGKGIPTGKYRITIQQNVPKMTAELQRYNDLYTEAGQRTASHRTGPGHPEKRINFVSFLTVPPHREKFLIDTLVGKRLIDR
jgi:hypothetical protein